MQEFNSATELKIQEIVRILEPHIVSRDGEAIGAGIVECQALHGTDLLKAAWIRLTRSHLTPNQRLWCEASRYSAKRLSLSAIYDPLFLFIKSPMTAAIPRMKT